MNLVNAMKRMMNVTGKVCWSCKRIIRLNTDAVYEEKESQWYHQRCFKKTFPEAGNPTCYGCGQAIKITKAQYNDGKWYHRQCLVTEEEKQKIQQGDILQNGNGYLLSSPAKTEKICYSCKQPIGSQSDSIFEQKGSQWYHIRCFKKAFPEAKNPTCFGCGQAIKRTKAQYNNGNWYHEKCVATKEEKQGIQHSDVLQNSNGYSRSSHAKREKICYLCKQPIGSQSDPVYEEKGSQWYHQRCFMKAFPEARNPTCYGCRQPIKRTKAQYNNGKWYHKKCIQPQVQQRNKLKEIRRGDVLSVMRNGNGYSHPAPAKSIHIVSGGLVRPK